jgi:hypothetical protein
VVFIVTSAAGEIKTSQECRPQQEIHSQVIEALCRKAHFVTDTRIAGTAAKEERTRQ